MRNMLLKAYTWARSREEGQGVVEYALVIGAVSVLLVVVLATEGEKWIEAVTSNVTDALT